MWTLPLPLILSFQSIDVRIVLYSEEWSENVRYIPNVAILFWKMHELIWLLKYERDKTLKFLHKMQLSYS